MQQPSGIHILPTIEELRDRLQSAQSEVRSLKRELRLRVSLDQAEQAHRQRQPKEKVSDAS